MGVHAQCYVGTTHCFLTVLFFLPVFLLCSLQTGKVTAHVARLSTSSSHIELSYFKIKKKKSTSKINSKMKKVTFKVAQLSVINLLLYTTCTMYLYNI